VNITLVTVGSRGDVHPYVALGGGLKSAGHSVRIATHAYFERLIRERGLEFAPIAGDPRETVESDAGQAWLATGSNPVMFFRRMIDVMRPLMAAAVDDGLGACRDADLVLYSMLGWFGAHHVIEKLGVNGMATYLQPATPTREFPPLFSASRLTLGGFHYGLQYSVGEQLVWELFRRSVNDVRRTMLSLPPMPRRAPFAALRRRGIPSLYGYSPSFLPKPADWPDYVHVTGYWLLERDTAWQPPRGLVEFLDAGEPPVYVGFGSMHTRSATQQTRVVIEALTRAEQRGILLTGWGALSNADLPSHVLGIDSVPHDWLFPRVAAVVHHCGTGTTGAGLRAGVPTVPIPFFADQPFWARRLHELGIASRPIPIRRLTVRRLADAIRCVVATESIRDRATAIGDRVRSENGVARAVELVERYASRT
jgi:UDP:flavonoid glycosyltransferase YjiC (YdhE family)